MMQVRHLVLFPTHSPWEMLFFITIIIVAVVIAERALNLLKVSPQDNVKANR